MAKGCSEGRQKVWTSKKEGPDLFMRKWHETERHKAAEQRAKTAAALSTVDICTRLGGGGREKGVGGGGGRGRRRGRDGRRRGVLPKSLKSGSGRHRLEICGSSDRWPSHVSVKPPWLVHLVAFSPQCH